MDHNIQQQLLNGLKVIADKLGTSAQYIYQVAVRQKIIDGYECLGAAIIFFLVALLLVFLIRPAYRHSKNSHDDSLVFGITCIVLVVMIMLTMVLTINAIDLLANPSYWAIKDILESVTRH
jgi:Kef-type K+ transport system membrane component KefB